MSYLVEVQAPARVTSADHEVTFQSDSRTLHASLRLPADVSTRVPAALIIAGSGPTDRNGNSAVAGHELKLNTYRWLADQLSARGHASLRYDKLGSGATGLGPYQAEELGSLSFQDTFVRDAEAALAYLAEQPGVDASKLTVIGHSEGGMVALALANGRGPTPSRLVLLEPQYGPILGILESQVESKMKDAVAAGALSAADGVALTAWLKAGVRETIAGDAGSVPVVLPLPEATGVAQQLQTLILVVLYNPKNRNLLKTENELDPLALAAQVTMPGSVLVTCGTKDWNTPCAQVRALAEAFPAGVARLLPVPNTVHELRDVGAADPATLSPVDYLAHPFSAALADALQTF